MDWTFEEMCEDLLNGGIARRAGWPAGDDYIQSCYAPAPNEWYFLKVPPRSVTGECRVTDLTVWVPSEDDKSASDWIVKRPDGELYSVEILRMSFQHNSH